MRNAYQAYVGCFTNPAEALVGLAGQAGIAVAWLDRAAIEAGSRTLSDDEWNLVCDQLDQYDGLVSDAGLNGVFLERIFSEAGVDRFPDTADRGSGGHATA